jgi:hypothetical protein
VVPSTVIEISSVSNFFMFRIYPFVPFVRRLFYE